MRNNTTQYPRPVLNEYLRDFKDSKFEISAPSFEETSDSIIFNFSYILACAGIEKLIEEGYAKVIIRLTCSRTSYRAVFELKTGEETQIIINKKHVVDSIDIQGIIVATQAYSSYKLNEFNKNYFGELSFVLRKGDVVANEPGMEIKLNTVLEKTAAGVVLIAGDATIETTKVRYATLEETDPMYTNYIIVLLPQKEFETYKKLTKKKHLKYGIERFLQATLILPAIVEAISIIKEEELSHPEDVENHYLGTVWADSLITALAKNGIEDLTITQKTNVELANIILGDVVSDSISDLIQKMTDWSTIRQEEDIL